MAKPGTFPPGVSGNPGGKPKTTPEFKAFEKALQKFSPEGAALLVTQIKSGVLVGNELIQALKLAFSYAWGNPKQIVDVEATVNQNSFVVHVNLDAKDLPKGVEIAQPKQIEQMQVVNISLETTDK